MEFKGYTRHTFKLSPTLLKINADMKALYERKKKQGPKTEEQNAEGGADNEEDEESDNDDEYGGDDMQEESDNAQYEYVYQIPDPDLMQIRAVVTRAVWRSGLVSL